MKKNYHLRGALHNLSSAENGSRPNINDYCHGVVIGVISVLIDGGASFNEAFGLVKDNLPDDYDRKRIPNGYRNLL